MTKESNTGGLPDEIYANDMNHWHPVAGEPHSVRYIRADRPEVSGQPRRPQWHEDSPLGRLQQRVHANLSASEPAQEIILGADFARQILEQALELQNAALANTKARRIVEMRIDQSESRLADLQKTIADYEGTLPRRHMESGMRDETANLETAQDIG